MGREGVLTGVSNLQTVVSSVNFETKSLTVLSLSFRFLLNYCALQSVDCLRNIAVLTKT